MITQAELNALENPGQLVSNHLLVADLQKALVDAPQDLNTLRGALASVIHRQAWMKRLDPTINAKYTYAAHEFRRFVYEPRPDGLESTEEAIQTLIGADKDLLDRFTNALKPEKGGQIGNQNAAASTPPLPDPDPSGNGHYTIQSPPGPASPGESVTTNHCITMVRCDRPVPPPKQGTRAYILRRLERAASGNQAKGIPPDPKATELLDLVNRGEMSANRASKEMNWRRDKTPLEQLRHWWGKASAEERRQFEAERGWSPA